MSEDKLGQKSIYTFKQTNKQKKKQKGDVAFYTLVDWKAVKLTGERGDVIAGFGSCDNPGSNILDTGILSISEVGPSPWPSGLSVRSG